MTPMPPLMIAAIAMTIAPFIGSFLSVLVVRLPLGEGVVLGRSHCRSCSRTLGPAELIPLVSWMVQGGKCSACGASVSALYPAMEVAATAVAFWAVTAVPPDLVIVSVLLGWVLLALAVMDVRSFFLSDLLTLPLIPVGLAVVWTIDAKSLPDHLAATAAGFVLMEAVAWAYRTLRGREGLGQGDSKLMAGAGAWLGLSGLGAVLLVGVCVNVAMLLIERILGHRIDNSTQVPLGTGLAAGIWLTWLYGPISLGA
jgi:leader peptidase (prepilin peptidase)/N-methyltransferase